MSRGITLLHVAAEKAGKRRGRFVQTYSVLAPENGVWWFALNDLGSSPDEKSGVYMGQNCQEAMGNLDRLPDAEPTQPKTAPVVPISAPKGRRRNVKEAQDG